jgi:hypothetical protein
MKMQTINTVDNSMLHNEAVLINRDNLKVRGVLLLLGRSHTTQPPSNQFHAVQRTTDTLLTGNVKIGTRIRNITDAICVAQPHACIAGKAHAIVDAILALNDIALFHFAACFWKLDTPNCSNGPMRNGLIQVIKNTTTPTKVVGGGLFTGTIPTCR